MIFIKKLGNIPKTNEVLYKMNELEQSRKEINNIDEQMAHLFERRMNVCAKIAGYKKEHGLSVRDPAREEDLINKNKSLIEDAELEPYYVRFLRNNIDVSCEYQSKAIEGIKVSYCGTEGAFSQLAAKRMFPEAELAAFREFAGAYNAVESGECDCAVLPLENSSAGIVAQNYDLLMEYDNCIVGEQIIKIDHCLLGTKDAQLSDITQVYSHPQGLMQCAGFLEAHRGWESISTKNTAMAAKKIKEDAKKNQAAIASRLTADIYGLKLLKESVQDNPNNSTRFIIVSSKKMYVRDAKKISICFEIPHESGSLYHALSHFIYNNLNMDHIESRPIQDRNWEYRFFIDFVGNLEDCAVKNALRGLKEETVKLKILGNY